MEDTVKKETERILERAEKTTDPIKKASGVVKGHNVGFLNKALNLVFAESFDDVAKSVLNEIVGPHVKDFVADIFIGAIERAVYGNDAPKKGDSKLASSVRSIVTGKTSYEDYYNSQKKETRVIEKKDSLFDEVVMKDRASAMELLDILNDRIKRYGRVTVNDLNDTLERKGKFNDSYFGWTNLENVRISRVYDGYLVTFPQPMELK